MEGVGAALSVVEDHLHSRFDRYASSGSLNFVGFRYLIRSCPGVALSEEELHVLFGRHANAGASLSFEGFRTVLADISRTMYIDAGAADASSAAAVEAAFLKLAANHVVPQVLQHPSVAAVLGGGVPAASSGAPYPVPASAPAAATPMLYTGTVVATSGSPPRDPVDPFLRASALLDVMAQHQAATASYGGPGSGAAADGYSGSAGAAAAPRVHPFATAAHSLAGFYGVAQAHAPAATAQEHAGVAQLQAQARQALAQAQAQQAAEQAHADALAEAQAQAQAQAQARSYGYSQLQHGSRGEVTSPSAPMSRAIEAAAADLPAFLEALQLSSLLPLLRLLGCETSADVGELREEELEGAGVKAIHIRRLKAAVTRLGAPARPQSAAAAVAAAEPGAADLHLHADVHNDDYHHSASAHTSPQAQQRRSPASYAHGDGRSGASTPHSAARCGGSAPGSASEATGTGAVSLPSYEWEQFATPDGFIYYHRPSTGETQWDEPLEGRIRTLEQRAAEQAAIAAAVQNRVASSLLGRHGGGRSRSASPARDGSSGSGSGAGRAASPLLRPSLPTAVNSLLAAKYGVPFDAEAAAAGSASARGRHGGPTATAVSTARSGAAEPVPGSSSSSAHGPHNSNSSRHGGGAALAGAGSEAFAHAASYPPLSRSRVRAESAVEQALGDLASGAAAAPSSARKGAAPGSASARSRSSPRVATGGGASRPLLDAELQGDGEGSEAGSGSAGGAVPLARAVSASRGGSRSRLAGSHKPLGSAELALERASARVKAQADAGGAIFHTFHRREPHLLGKASSSGRLVGGKDVVAITSNELALASSLGSTGGSSVGPHSLSLFRAGAAVPPPPLPAGPTSALGVTITGTAAPKASEVTKGFLHTSAVAPTPGSYPYVAPDAAGAADGGAPSGPSSVYGSASEAGPGPAGGEYLSLHAGLAAIGDRKMASSYTPAARRAASAAARVKAGADAAREYRTALRTLVDAHYHSTADGTSGTTGGAAATPPAVMSAADIFPGVYESLPSMDARTFDAIARHGMVVNSKRLGYADPRPDVRPPRTMMPAAGSLYGDARTHHVHADPKQAIDLVKSQPGLGGKAEGVWVAQLRPNLHGPGASGGGSSAAGGDAYSSSSKEPRSPRSGKDIKQFWASGGLAPSEAATGYAYRHAAAHSMLTGSGSVYDRLTDPRGYTGSHRHRFDGDGRGLGLAGRGNSIDYRFLVDTIVDEKHGQAPLPGAPLADLRQHSAGMGRR